MPQSKGSAIGDSCENSDVVPKTVIPDDGLIVQILSRLDYPSYSQALRQDAGSINENFLFPPHFPWHSRTRLSQKMAKTMPRDIDDLHVISQCQGELQAPFGDFRGGAFGFGRYENGQSRGNYSRGNNGPPFETLLLEGNDTFAAARRSYDPGVLELNILTKLPSSIDSMMNGEDSHALTPAEKWEAELMKDPDRAGILSHLPFSWSKRGKSPQISDQKAHSANATTNVHLEHDFESRKFSERRSRSRAQIDLVRSCSRKWNLSMKIAGVSSRSTLFPPTSVVIPNSEKVPENSKKVIRPMLRLALLPQSIQTGTTVSVEKASEMDKTGFAHGLGSYDARFTDALLNPKKDSVSRAKRVEVGRTRLVWSNLIQGDEPFLPSTRNRVNFNSLLTGRRLDLAKCRRPTEVKVGLRLNGRLVMEEALEDVTTNATASARKRKQPSTRQQSEAEGLALKSRTLCPESRTEREIDTALQNHFPFPQSQHQKKRLTGQSNVNGAVVYIEKGEESSMCSGMDRNNVIASLMKFNQKKSAHKRLKRIPSSGAIAETTPALLGGTNVIKKSSSPRYACLPLEDGLLRTVCLTTGNMAGAAVHQVLCDLSHNETVRRCSVCWSDEGSGMDGVQKCIKCGLLAHPNCCVDRGEFSTAATSGGQDNQPLCFGNSKQNQEGNSNDTVQVDLKHCNSQVEQWKCAVCCRYKDRTRRTPRLPSRFVDGETQTPSMHTGDGIAIRNVNVPGPHCVLCPHRGGAMSPLESSDKWVHEVCRIWSRLDATTNSFAGKCSPPSKQYQCWSILTNVCALCGTGKTKESKSMQFSGLTKCAAHGCFVTFHPMCALLASKVGMGEKDNKSKLVRTRKTRHTDHTAGEKKSDVSEDVEVDKKLCKEYTLQLVRLVRPKGTYYGAKEEQEPSVVPVAFCGIHNPQRQDAFFGRLPGGAIV